MRFTLLTLAAAASIASAQTSEIPLGKNCTPGGTPCALGAGCYAVNSMLQPVCGNFQASCTSDKQCAFNTCQGGLCSGFIPTSTPVAPASSAQTSEIPLGKNCTPGGTPCALGAGCYAVNSMLQPVCGNFQASCTSDKQCAFNTCQGGLCSGFIPTSAPVAPASSASPTVSSSKPQGPQPAPSPTIVAPAGSLPLGALCNPYVKPEQCANAQCWASNMMVVPRCGNYNAECTTDANCFKRTCVHGACIGVDPTASAGTGNATMTTMPAQNPSSGPGPIVNGTMIATKSATPTTTAGTTEFTGAASADFAAGGLVALVAGAVAMAL